ncbi:hypothetical protein [Ranid herpesvirus 3]|uniref:Uncharacterized protein n=1 Tax=Ranid herpesvirus 3 TaxID=1987509 RepID=A0A1X9T5A9_9VIRU|nr:hypothetical protein [Ranid herpesvirus 3]ARR28888.1 hypothetical protein [Ranid herpesvirus 3]
MVKTRPFNACVRNSKISNSCCLCSGILRNIGNVPVLPCVSPLLKDRKKITLGCPNLTSSNKNESGFKDGRFILEFCKSGSAATALYRRR